ncbi:MAG TPA: glycosyltransferase family 1 protein [Planctomycetota bacterium]|nr:glycosyltransferase family 1 protein [Planctomycetota bacterium]
MARSVVVEMLKLSNQASGLGQFCRHLGRALAAAAPAGLDLTLHGPANCRSLFPGNVRYHDARIWDRWNLPLRGRAELWHCTHQDARLLPCGRTRLLLTVHDLNFLYQHDGARRRSRLAALQRRLDRAHAITAVSQHTAQELQHLQLRGKPVRVIHNGNSLVPHPDAPRPAFAPPAPFLLAVGVFHPRKNLHLLPAMLPQLPQLQLVLAGQQRPAYLAQVRAAIAAAGVQGRVVLPGEVSDADRYWLYTHCEALVFPSRSEGFGLPAIEAMSCGKPVFLARATSLPEIGGEAAFYFDALEPTAMATTVGAGLQQFRADRGHAERLRRRAATFSWASAARAYLDVYQSC